MEAAEFGFIEGLDCTVSIKIQGECHSANESILGYCQPLFGFGDRSNYFIASYLTGHDTNEIAVFPQHGVDDALASGDVTSILANYDGTEQGRDDQFYDAVTALDDTGYDAFRYLEALKDNVWPIYLRIQRDESGVSFVLGNGSAYWPTPFAFNSSLHFGILDRLTRPDLGLDLNGFTISLITISRSCSELPDKPTKEFSPFLLQFK